MNEKWFPENSEIIHQCNFFSVVNNLEKKTIFIYQKLVKNVKNIIITAHFHDQLQDV